MRLDRDGFHAGGQRRPVPRTTAELLAALRDALSRAPKPGPQIAGVPLAGGLVGYAAYDVVRFFEKLPLPPGRDSGVPALHYVAPRSLLVFDHLTRGIALLHDGSEEDRRALRKEVVRALRGGLPTAARPGRYARPESAFSRNDYLAGVRRTQEYIAAGDVYQLVLSTRFQGRHELDPFQAYRALRLINPSPYMYYCALGDVTVVGSSPEALVRAQGGPGAAAAHRRHPAARGRSRGRPGARSRAARRSQGKRRARDAGRSRAQRPRARGARRAACGVEPYRAIERYSHVMHMVSGVGGELAPGRDAFDLFAATFPAGTLVGAPKVRAMQIIDELEPVSRGLYGGTVGYFGARGDMDHAITIRTLVFSGDEYSYQAGAGIVADSVPATEHEEVLAKSARHGARARAGGGGTVRIRE